MEKIYWSKNQDHESWPDEVGCYWFPFAERLMRSRYTRWIVLGYVWIRMKLRPTTLTAGKKGKEK